MIGYDHRSREIRCFFLGNHPDLCLGFFNWSRSFGRAACRYRLTKQPCENFQSHEEDHDDAKQSDSIADDPKRADAAKQAAPLRLSLRR